MPPLPSPLEWHVQYRDGACDRVAMHSTPEAACRLMDQKHDVYGIGTGPLTDSVGRAHIARIYSMWKDAKRSRFT